MNPTASMTASAATGATTTAIAAPAAITIPKQLPTPSRKACEVAFITLAETLSDSPSFPEDGQSCTPEQSIDINSYQLCQIGIPFSCPFQNFFGHIYDTAAVEELPAELNIKPGSVHQERHIRNISIVRFFDFCLQESGLQVREGQNAEVDSLLKRTKERMINAWQAYDVYVDSRLNTVIEVVEPFFSKGTGGPIRELAKIVSDYVGDDALNLFEFGHKPLVAQIFSSLKITSKEASKQVLVKLEEAETKDQPSADTQSDRKVIVREHINQLFNYASLYLISSACVAPEKFSQVDQNSPPQLKISASILRRTGTTTALDEEISNDELNQIFLYNIFDKIVLK